MNEIDNSLDEKRKMLPTRVIKRSSSIDLDYFGNDDEKSSENNRKIIDRSHSVSVKDLYESKDIFPSHKDSMERIKLFFGGSGSGNSGNNNTEYANNNNTNTQPTDNLSTTSTSHRKKRHTSSNTKTLKASQKMSAVNRQKDKMMSSINSSATRYRAKLNEKANKSSIISKASNSRARLNEKRLSKKKNVKNNEDTNNNMEDDNEDDTQIDTVENEPTEPKIDNISSINHTTTSGDVEAELVETKFLGDDEYDENKQNEDDLSTSSLSSREQRRVDIMQKFPSSYAFVPSGVRNNEENDDSSTDSDCPLSNDESKLLTKETKTSHLKSDPDEQQRQQLNDSTSTFDSEVYSNAQSERETVESIQTNVLQNFATEHRIFLRTILAILTERDTLSSLVLENGPNCSASHPFNKDSACILISGPLKKASHIVRGVWRVKYAEVRRGIFSYYEDNINNDAISGTSSLKKKSLPLRASMVICRAVKVTPKLNMRPSVDCTTEPNDNVGGAVFELTVEGGPRRLFLTTCREERQSWIHAIHEAMIGAATPFAKMQSMSLLDSSTVSPLDNWELIKMGIPLHYSSYQSDLLMYLSAQKEVKASSDANAYRSSMNRLLGKTITVPVQWIKEQIEVAPDFSASDKKFKEESIHLGIDQLWKDLLRDSVSINNVVYKGDTGHGPERIIGALSRCILEFDSTFDYSTFSGNKNKCRISPKQAVIYARDILLACNRTRSGGDSYYCVDNLCTNSSLMFLRPYSAEAEPLSITISHVTSDNTFIDQDDSLTNHRELNWMMWIKSKTKSQKSWKKLFFILSQSGVLSWYEKQHPRPHGLKGQLVLEGATMAISEIPLHSNKSNQSDAIVVNQPGNLKGSLRKFVGSSTPLLCADHNPDQVIIKQNNLTLGKRSNALLSTTSKVFLIWIRPTDSSKERRFLFDDEEEFTIWKNALEKVLSSVSGSIIDKSLHRRQQQAENSSGNKISTFFKNRVLSPNNRAFDDYYLTPKQGEEEQDLTSIVSVGAKTASSATKSATSESQQIEQSKANTEAQKTIKTSFATDVMATSTIVADNNRLERKTNSFLVRYESTVLVEVEASTFYKICTLDPQGDEVADTWFTLQTKFSQNFRLCGGQNGRMFRGEEAVQMSFLDGLATSASFGVIDQNKKVHVKNENK